MSRCFRFAGVLLFVAACSDNGAAARAQASADSVAALPVTMTGNFSAADANAIGTLAGPVGAVYREGVSAASYTVSGVVEADESIAGDSLIEPTHDANSCKPFRDVSMPRRKAAVGNAIVWIAGVNSGKANTLPRRSSIRLNDCRLEPRVHVVAAGGTVMVGSRDAMVSRLRFIDAIGNANSPRAIVSLNDFGQIVPEPAIARTPGLIEVRDDKHPWVRGFIAVAAHPYVAVTDASGTFRFDSVPAGRYEIVVFSEALGVMRRMLEVRKDSVLVLRLGSD